MLTYQSMVFINRRIEGNFPNYKQLIPATYVTKSCFATQDLITAVKRVGLVKQSFLPLSNSTSTKRRKTPSSTQRHRMSGRRKKFCLARWTAKAPRSRSTISTFLTG